MFTGIVEATGTVKVHDLAEKWGKIAVEVPDWADHVQDGDSVAVSGICLTVTRKEGAVLHFDVLRETFEKTTLGERAVGDRINLERALRWGQTMGGHILVGHVDGVGECVDIQTVGRDWKFEFTCSPELMDGIVYKGSVGIDGVSLTVAELKESSFVVHIIPFTYEFTTFSNLKVGSHFNLEVDVLGKFVKRLLDRGASLQGISWEALRAEGLINEATSEEE